jgi:hypothetical protein
MTADDDLDAELAFTVAAIWRQERISCPHPHVLKSWLQGGLPPGAAEFVEFHLRDSSCPYCHAVIEDLKAQDASAQSPVLQDLKERLLRSTVAALRQTRA